MFSISMFLLIAVGICGLSIHFRSLHQYQIPNIRNCSIYTS